MVLSLLVLLGAGEAAAYCLMKTSGPNPYVAWKTMPVTYRVANNITDPQLLAAIDAAFATWGSVSCSTLAFQKGAPFTMCTQTPCPSGTVPFLHATPYIYVYWFSTSTGFPSNSQYVVSMYLWHDQYQAIVGGSLALNAFTYQWNASGGNAAQSILDLQNGMTAFIGHVIGLDDSKVPGATMYPGIAYGDTSKRTLEQDDINGLVYLYKAASCPAPPPPGPNGCSAPPPPSDAPVPLDASSVLPDAGPGTEAGVDGPGVADLSSGDLSSGDGPGPLADGPATDGPMADDASHVDQSAAGDGPASPADGGVGDGGAGDGTGGDPKIWAPPEEDTGCCRVSHARRADGASFILLALLWLLFLRRRSR